MIVFTKQGNREDLPLLFAFDEGVYCFEFYGDETYTDPFDSSVWTWEGTDTGIEEVLGVAQDDGRQLAVTVSLSDCKALQGSFYWDDLDGVLYVHWFDSLGDWAISRSESSFSQIIAGFASGYNKTTRNVYDGVYYEPIITDISGLSKNVDPTKFGLISFNGSTVSYANENGRFDGIDESETVGIPIWFYFAPDDITTLTDEYREFTGFYNGTVNNFSSQKFNVIETRLFENKPTCPNSVELSVYPDAGDQEGKTIPVAFGDIRRGKMIPVNLDSLTEAGAGTAIFLVADPSLYAVRAINKLYDKDENELTISSFNLTDCTVEYTKPSGVAPNDLKNYKWEGEGYDISGTYNNGLDIIRAAFLKLANIPYLASTYNIPEYGQAIVDNPSPVGLSIQSDKGFIEQIVEPITTSLQGIVDIQGDGKITWRSRDTSRPVAATIIINDQVGEPNIEISPKETVSDLTVSYSPDFVDKTKNLTYNYSDQRSDVISNFSINRKSPLSPVETVLAEQSDARLIAIEIMETSASPSKLVSSESINFYDVKLFDIIGIDVGRYGTPNIIYGEILTINPKYLREIEGFKTREIENPVFRPIPSIGYIFDDFIFDDRIFGPTINPFNEGEL